MTLTASAPTSVKTSAGGPRIAKCATGVAVILYTENSVTECYAKVADVTGGSLSLGSEQTIENDTMNLEFVGSYGFDMKEAGSNKVILAYNADPGLQTGRIRTIARSGNTLTPGTAADTIANFTPTTTPRVDINDAGTEAIVQHLYFGATKGYASVDVSGSTCVADTEVTQTSALDSPVTTTHMDSTKFLSMYLSSDNSIYFQVVDVSSGITQGTEDDSGHDMVGSNNYRQLCAITTSKAVAVFGRDDTTDALSAMVVNISGTSIASYGSVLDIFTGTPTYVACDAIDSTSFIAIYIESGALKVETFSVSGSTITSNGDAITISGAAASSTPQIVQVDTGKWIASWLDTTGDIQASYITTMSGTGNKKFYYGTNALTDRYDMSFTITNPDGLAVRADKTATLGAAAVGGGGEMVEQGGASDSYAAWTDITGSHATDRSVTGLKWVNGGLPE